MTIPTVPTIAVTVPAAPNRATDSAADFSTKADAFVEVLDPLKTAINTTVSGMNAAATAIDAVGVAATTSAGNAAASEANALTYKNAASTSAANAATSEGNAAGSAATAVAASGVAAGFTATSTTSLTVGLGSKALTLAQTGKTFVVGDFVVVASSAGPSNFMTGQVTAFTAGTGAMTVNVTGIGGSGTIASWNVALSGQPAAPVTSGTLTGVLNLAATQSIAAASTTDIAGANSNTVTITGTVTITAFGTAADGATRNVLFSGALTLTHNATSLILPGAANIVTAAGDTAEVQSLGSGNWRVTRYTRANGLPVFGGGIRRSVQTAGFTAGINDNGTIFELSSASAQTLAFTAAATLGPTWSCWWVNTSTGTWTADPNASELIDGAASYAILPGEARLVTCDGTGFKTVIVKPFHLTMPASGTFPTLAPGYASADGILWGAAAGGCINSGDPATGAAGVPFSIAASRLASAVTVTIAGATAASATSSKNFGASSTFGSLITALGGRDTANVSGWRGIIPVATAGTVAAAYLDQFSGGQPSVFAGLSNGALAIYGGGSGGDASYAAGTSLYAGDGGAYAVATNGGNGQAPGGGGGNADSGRVAGTGGRGELRIWGVVG